MVDRLVDGWVDKREWVPGGIHRNWSQVPGKIIKKPALKHQIFGASHLFHAENHWLKKYIPLFFETCVDDADDARNMEKHVINRETLQHAAKGKNITSNC